MRQMKDTAEVSERYEVSHESFNPTFSTTNIFPATFMGSFALVLETILKIDVLSYICYYIYIINRGWKNKENTTGFGKNC